jgi:uncharacterized membrane protein YeaQ/YmgE (transglycosylase-associated protein family)
MTLIVWAVTGVIAGSIAKALLPLQWPGGWLPCAALGCLGSVVGGLPFGQGPAGMVGSIVGACVVLYLYTAWSQQS